ncbi:MAG: hypothetical protein HY519_00760, partial [Candidatus Aenigmarchaeota archaeon]|nr:hypothetical protein [Candidatus Aenigmarchaeota archaeon]
MPACYLCRGNHAYRNCPQFLRLYQLPPAHAQVGTSFSGSSVTLFVGRHGYPNVSVGLLAMPEIDPNAWTADAPAHWFEHGYGITQVVQERARLINSKSRSTVRASSRLLETMQEVALAANNPTAEISLGRPPAAFAGFAEHMPPVMSSAPLR